MKELNVLEKEVINTISKYSIYTSYDVRKVYESCESFDKTIQVLQYAGSHGIGLREAFQLVEERP